MRKRAYRIKNRGTQAGETLRAVDITNRVDPCGCGCKGSDPHHARNFTRTITQVEEVPTGTQVRTRAYGTGPVRRIGWARFPWGRERVAEVYAERFDFEAGRMVPVLDNHGAQYVIGWAIASGPCTEAEREAKAAQDQMWAEKRERSQVEYAAEWAARVEAVIAKSREHRTREGKDAGVEWETKVRALLEEPGVLRRAERLHEERERAARGA